MMVARNVRNHDYDEDKEQLEENQEEETGKKVTTNTTF